MNANKGATALDAAARKASAAGQAQEALRHLMAANRMEPEVLITHVITEHLTAPALRLRQKLTLDEQYSLEVQQRI